MCPGTWPEPRCEGHGALLRPRDCPEEVTLAGVACSENGMGKCLLAGKGAHVWETPVITCAGAGRRKEVVRYASREVRGSL